MLKAKILWYLNAILLVIALFIAYQIWFAPRKDAWNFVPDNAFLVVESSEIQQSLHSKIDPTHLADIPFFYDALAQLKKVGESIDNEEIAKKFFTKKLITYSLHRENKKNLEYIIYIPAGAFGDDSFLNNLLVPNATKRKVYGRNYKGLRINELYDVYPGAVAVGGLYFANTQLLLNFLTPHPSDMLPARNIVPFYELPRYITPWSADPAALTVSGLSVSAPSTFTIRTQSLQLNQIPDKLILYVRKNISLQSWTDADVCFPISTVTVNFNNNSGILASAKQVDLWQMSRNNGLQENWHEFKGLAIGSPATGTPTSATASQTVFSTVGSYLVLEFGKDIQLTEDFYAAGSLGNFNLQINITCENNRPYTLRQGDGAYDNNVEAVLITMNSGVFVCERGTSSTYTGILTKQDVLEASQQDHYTHDDVERMVGGGFFDKIKSGFSKLASKGMEYGKRQLAKHGNRLIDKGANYLMKKGKKALAKYTQPADEEDED